MKKDRNCGNAPYPVYPSYQGMGMMPGPMFGNMMQGNMAPMPNTMPMFNQSSVYQVSGTIEQQLSNLNNQVSSLEKRVNALESLVGNKYNSSNFQIM